MVTKPVQTQHKATAVTMQQKWAIWYKALPVLPETWNQPSDIVV
jgi:hypothetical protein